MMSILGIADAVSGVVQGIGGAVSSVTKVFAGDRSARDQQTHEENAAVLDEFASEFRQTNRTWFDSLIDGLNRLPRPLMALGVIGVLVWCPIDPVGFAEAMQAYGLVPEWLAGVIITVAGFYFTFRHLEKRLEMKGPSPDQVKAVLETQAAIRQQRQKTDAVSPEPGLEQVQPMPEPAFQAEMADTKKPLSNTAILEWNRRRQEGWKP